MAVRFRRIPAYLCVLALAASCTSGSDPATQPVLASLRPVAGGGQRAWPGMELPDELILQALDEDGQPYASATVTWAVTAGDGTVSSSSSVTGSDGLASVRWTLGRSTVVQSVTAATGSGLSVVFEAEAALLGTWERVADLLHPVRAPAVATDGTRLLVFGGSGGGNARTAHTQIFDPATGVWADGAQVPTAIEWSTAVYRDGRVHLLGGVTETAAASTGHWIYDIASDAWSEGSPLPSAAAGSASGLAGGDILVVGGIDGPGHYSDHLRVLDPTGAWIEEAPAPDRRINWQGAVIDGLFYVAGGSTNGRVTTSSLYMYDPEAKAWSSLQPMAAANEGYAGTGAGGLYCVLGGRTTPTSGSFNAPFDRFECFVPGMNAWMAGPRLAVAVEEAGAAWVGGKLYVIGGRISFEGVTGAVYRIGG